MNLDYKNIDEGTAFFAVQRILLIMLTEDFEKEELTKLFIRYFAIVFFSFKIKVQNFNLICYV